MARKIKGWALLLTALWVAVAGLGVQAWADSAGKIRVRTRDDLGNAIQNVPIIVDGNSIYSSGEEGEVILAVEQPCTVTVPPVFRDRRGTQYTFDTTPWTMEAGYSLTLRPTETIHIPGEEIPDGLYRVVEEAAAKQLDHAYYWLPSSVSSTDYLNTVASEAIARVRREYPEYYLSNETNVNYLSYSQDGAYDLIQYNLTYAITDKQKIREINAQVKSLVSQAAGLSDFGKLQFFHDAIIARCDYDDQAAASGSDVYPDAFNAYGALVGGKAVCEGYADAFQLLCDTAGLECYIVTGTLEGGPHAWNYVRLDGVLYAVDCTNDDLGQQASYQFFLAGSKKMDQTHKPDGSEPGILSKKDHIRVRESQ